MQEQVGRIIFRLKKCVQVRGPLSFALAAAWRSWAALRIEVRPETLALIGSIYFVVFCNASFWGAILNGHPMRHPSSWFYATCLFVLLVGLQLVFLALVMNRWTAKPIFSLLIITTAAATYFMGRYGTYFDPAMIRNVLATDLHEARELLAMDMLPHLLWYAVIPLLMLSRVRVRIEPLSRTWWIKPATISAALVIAVGALLPITQQLVPRMREQKELRHLITPGNYIASLLRVATQQRHLANKVRTKIGLDAHKAAGMEKQKPLLMIVIVGETVRANNWGLNGYARQTTPRLAGLDVFNFSDVAACGTNTEVSVPCMFSAYGRGHYDEEKIRSSESFLHVLNRSGMRVLWRDNQSGCKGVCDGLEAQAMQDHKSADLCDKDGCFDEILLKGLNEELEKTPGDFVIVLHQMGNHGPAYHLRYPERFRQFTPTCMTSELGSCTREQIVNTYDNAILYTDYVLSQTISYLDRHTDKRRVAMLYLSDHGESLGENGIYLHSLPYSIAPEMQIKVPMVVWMPNNGDSGVDQACLRARAIKPASHDNLFHTVLGLAGVETTIYNPALDVMSGCRLNQAQTSNRAMAAERSSRVSPTMVVPVITHSIH